ncbi:heme biosynthesis protein HemY [Candidatus Symbiobacter mobilis]|uniref:HemY protein n=1 Tax=Candidatus Symbiobacter mobilis CR TaxID=946483 RepID=U5N8Z6_9BURK|nr:heme biosynthesis HemY N-terminal domain-containing protein [Candidatus Symbiobacter mobilis]AGX87837.1 HemY protein [Candidatus Symbiobacter mobilis CR]
MRVALWLVGLFAVAVGLAGFAQGNAAMVTIFWPPHRIDVSLHFALFVLALLFVLLHLSLRALSALWNIPQRAQAWRERREERLAHDAILDAITHLLAGRFLRARKSAQWVLEQTAPFEAPDPSPPWAARLTVLAHWLAAESAHALRDPQTRATHCAQALDLATALADPGHREGVLLRAVAWAHEDRDAEAALRLLEQLPAGAARRTLALRLRLKVTRMAGHTILALETARLLVKHRAVPASTASGLLNALVQESIRDARTQEELLAVWQQLDSAESLQPDIACRAAQRWLRLGGTVLEALDWLIPVWDRMIASPDTVSAAQSLTMVRALEDCFSRNPSALDATWLQRIERAQQRRLADPALQYLAGVACWHLQLWGKAQQLLRQALPRLSDPGLLSRGWQSLAELAHRQDDEASALLAWKNAARAYIDPSLEPTRNGSLGAPLMAITRTD